MEVNERDWRVEGDLPEADQGTRRVDGHAGQDVAQLRRGVVHEHAAQGEALNAMCTVCLSPVLVILDKRYLQGAEGLTL